MNNSLTSLVERTRELSVDTSYLSPFAADASKDSTWRQSEYIGGKVDDITVIVAAVVSERFDEETVYVDSVRE